MTSNVESKYLLPNDSGTSASGLTKSLDLGETVNQLGDAKDKIGNAIGDAKDKIGNAIGNAIGDAIGAVSTDFKNVTEVVTSEPAPETVAPETVAPETVAPETVAPETTATSEEETDYNQYPNYGFEQSEKNAFNPFSQGNGIRVGVGGNTRKRRFVKVPKITRNQKKKKRKQTRNPRRKQTRRTNKKTRKHRN
jgi:hypothetical protein